MATKHWKTAILAIIAGGVTIGFGTTSSPDIKILKAKTSIQKGQLIRSDLLEEVKVGKYEDWMIKPGTNLNGLVSINNIIAGEYLSQHDISTKKPITFLAGEREFTVQTDLSRCVGGDLKAGDWADILFFDKNSLQAQPLFPTVILDVQNRAGQGIHDNGKEIRDSVPATVKIKVTIEQAANLFTFEQRGLVAFAKVPDEVINQEVKK